LNEPLKAETALKTAIANDPKTYDFYIALADIYRYKFPNGGQLYEQTMADALQKFPNQVNIISQLASYYEQTNQTDKAIQYYEKQVQLDPANQAAKENLMKLKAIK